METQDYAHQARRARDAPPDCETRHDQAMRYLMCDMMRDTLIASLLTGRLPVRPLDLGCRVRPPEGE